MVQAPSSASSRTWWSLSRPKQSWWNNIKASTSVNKSFVKSSSPVVRAAPSVVKVSWTKQSLSKKRSSQDSILYVNDKIKAFEVIVVTEDWENLGKMSRYNALSLAKEQWLDLVQLSYNPIDKVCTARITDVGKYLYEKKKVAKEKKKTANKGMKQMKFSYSIADNDLDLKISKVKEMLDIGYTVRVFVQLKWRENIYKWKAVDKLHYVQKALDGYARSQSPEPKQDKNTFSYMFNSVKK